MSNRDHEEFHWRETYFILFRSCRRPTLTQVERVLGELGSRIEMSKLTANDDGYFESVMLQSPDDYAALEITFESGEAITEQAVEMSQTLEAEAEPEQLTKLTEADARLDVMHFEQVVKSPPGEEDEADELLDPSCLLMVVDALLDLTEGIAVDPASGAILP